MIESRSETKKFQNFLVFEFFYSFHVKVRALFYFDRIIKRIRSKFAIISGIRENRVSTNRGKVQIISSGIKMSQRVKLLKNKGRTPFSSGFTKVITLELKSLVGAFSQHRYAAKTL